MHLVEPLCGLWRCFLSLLYQAKGCRLIVLVQKVGQFLLNMFAYLLCVLWGFGWTLTRRSKRVYYLLFWKFLELFMFYFKENKLCRYKKLVISSDVLNSLRTYCTIWMNSSVLIWLILVFSFKLTDRSLKFTNTVGVHLIQRVYTRMYNVFKTANFNSILLFPEHIVQKTTKKFSAIK